MVCVFRRKAGCNVSADGHLTLQQKKNKTYINIHWSKLIFSLLAIPEKTPNFPFGRANIDISPLTYSYTKL